MVRDDEGFSEDETPTKRALRQKYTRYDIMDTIEPIRFKSYYNNVDNKTWENLTE